MSESCGRARRLLWPDKGPRSVDKETVAARRHMKGCADCRVFFGEMGTLSDAVRDSLGAEAAPIEIREAVYAHLAETRLEQRGRRWRAGLAAAAVLAVVFVGAVVLLRQSSPVVPLVSLVAGEHAKAVGGDRLASSDRGEVERWLAARVAFAVHVPVLSEARLTGARVCLTERGRGAIVEYAFRDRTMSYFVLPAPKEQLPVDDGVMIAAESGYRVALWRHTGLLHAMVGALSEDDLMRLAHECIDQTLRLARHVTFGLFTTS